jgi:UDP-glucuronate decarboxylase
MRELAELVLSETQSSSLVITEPLPQDDPRQRQPDISLAFARLGWAPKFTLREGLKPTSNYFHSILGADGQLDRK